MTAFSKCYRIHFELVSKYNTGLSSVSQKGVSEADLYGVLVYKFENTVRKTEFSNQFKTTIMRYYRIHYLVYVLRQSACLVVNPLTVNNVAVFLNSMPVGRVQTL